MIRRLSYVVASLAVVLAAKSLAAPTASDEAPQRADEQKQDGANLQQRGDDLQQKEEQAIQAAVAQVDPAVIRIETVGGLEMVGSMLFGTGATTGLAVSEDGYIVTSAFNFAQKPASILVTLPDGSRTPATMVATDHNRMVVLLKVRTDKPLTVPAAAPEKEVVVGSWAIAVGRTFDGAKANMSVGIVSALGRIWGKAIQTDAKVSPSNYGGPLVDIHGRVLGVLVPLSPQEISDVAGVEWYDSGIGFAIPLEEVNRLLPKLKEGKDLYPGILGVNMVPGDLYAKPAEIRTCRVNSPAAQAGLKAGDKIVEINGQKVNNQAELKTRMAPIYAGEKIRLTVLRGQERVERELDLVAKLEPFVQPFLGVLPLRVATKAPSGKEADSKSADTNDAEKKDAAKAAPEQIADAKAAGGEAGFIVRYVYPDSPAAKAGLKAGQRVTALDGKAIAGAAALAEQLGALAPGQKARLEVSDAGAAARTVELIPAALPEALPGELPPARAPTKFEGERPAVGTISIKVPEFQNTAVAYVPEGYDPQVPHGVVVWLHPAGGVKDDELVGQWKSLCDAHDLILLAPKSADPARWGRNEVAFIRKSLDEIVSTYNVDRARIVVHGQEGGGALAYVLAFGNRELIRGVAVVDAALPNQPPPPENDPEHRLAIYSTIGSDGAMAKRIEAGVKRLRDMKYPVTVKDLGNKKRYLTDEEITELVRWIDTLDRI